MAKKSTAKKPATPKAKKPATPKAKKPVVPVGQVVDGSVGPSGHV